MEKIDIIVVANSHRKALAVDYLQKKNIAHKVLITRDYELALDFKPEFTGYVQPTCHTGAYRCFRGHQDALKLCDKEFALILEDDAVPNCDRDILTRTIEGSIRLFEKFKMVSLHGRQYSRDQFCSTSYPGYIAPNFSNAWIVAALAYLIDRSSFSMLESQLYKGLPYDLLLYWNLKYCLLENSVFNHDRSEGSLIDV